MVQQALQIGVKSLSERGSLRLDPGRNPRCSSRRQTRSCKGQGGFGHRLHRSDLLRPDACWSLRSPSLAKGKGERGGMSSPPKPVPGRLAPTASAPRLWNVMLRWLLAARHPCAAFLLQHASRRKGGYSSHASLAHACALSHQQARGFVSGQPLQRGAWQAEGHQRPSWRYPGCIWDDLRLPLLSCTMGAMGHGSQAGALL